MSFLKVADNRGDPEWINTAHVQRFWPAAPGGFVTIALADGTRYETRTTLADLLEQTRREEE